MFGTIKKATVAGAVVAVAALAGPAMASADEWKIHGVPVTSATPLLEARGGLDIEFAGTSVRVGCSLATLDAELNANASVVINDMTLDCHLATPSSVGCSVTVEATTPGFPPLSSLPWSGAGDASTQRVEFSSVGLVAEFDSGCPGWLGSSPYPVPLTGSLSPRFDAESQSLNFYDSSNSSLLSPGTGLTPVVYGGFEFYADEDWGLTLE